LHLKPKNFRRLFLARHYQLRGETTAVKRLLRYHPDNFRMIVVLAEMPQNHRGGGGIELVTQIVAHQVVREVAVAAHYALFHGPGIRADLQHIEIVIGLEHQYLRAAQMELDGIGKIAEVGDETDFDALRAEAEAYGVDGVVRNGEGVDFDIAYREACAGLKRLDCRERAIPLDGGASGAS
jgi:hypothetical protein